MKKRIFYIISLALLFFFTKPMLSQDTNPLDFSVDYAKFRYDSSSNYLEVYYSFAQAKFKMIKQSTGFNGSALFTFKLFNKSKDSLVNIARWRSSFNIIDTAALSSDKVLTGIKSFSIPFGDFYFVIKIMDENNSKISDSLRFEIKSNPSTRNSIYLSDPELCVSIQQIEKDQNNIFYKNTLEVIPNPRLIYGAGLPIIYVYNELYNLDIIKSENYTYSVDVFTMNAKKIKSLPKQKKKLHESSVEVNAINCSDLPSGSYILRCSIIDENDTNQRALTLKKFFVYNPHIAQSKDVEKTSELISDEYALMNESDIDREFQIINSTQIADKNEKEQFSKLTTLDAKRIFMANFWKKKDSDPGTPENEFKDRFMKSIKHVNVNYRTGQKEGWKTDRGRVYVKYGSPDEIERHPNELESKPYEIWYFHNIEGGVQFVFIDRSGLGDYMLVHSTYRNEIQDENWSRLLK